MDASLQTDITVGDNSDSDRISAFLTSTSHVVSLILSYLKAKDLNRCATVCKFWSREVEKLKRKRKTKAWTCIQCEEENIDDICIAIKKFIQNVYTQPRFVIMFLQADLCDLEPKEEGNGNDICKFDSFIRSILPPGCELLGVSSGGLIGTSSDMKEIYEIEDEYGVSILCLPDYNSVNIVTCDCDGDEMDNKYLKTYKENLDQLLDATENSPCKAIFTYITEPSIPRRFVSDMNKQFKDVLIAGGYVDNLISPKETDTFPCIRSTAICGSKVNVASVVINETIKTAAEAEQKIIQLKKHGLLEQNSFAFMFACVGRGRGHYGEPNVESKLFKKHFPQTPLLGFFGNGEIGFDSPGNSGEVSENKGYANMECKSKLQKRQKVAPVKINHAYTTILVLVSVT